MVRHRLLLLLVTVVLGNVAHAQLLSLTSEPGYPVVRIDVETGARQTLLQTNVTVAYLGINTFDPQGRRLLFLTGSIGTQELVIVDVTSGVVTRRPIPLAPAGYVFFEYDSATGRVIAVTSQSGHPVVAIDPATGAVTHLVNTGTSVAYGGINAFDPVGRRLFFLTGAIGTQVLVTVDLDTNSVTQVPIAIPPPHGYILFRYDAVADRILAVTSEPGFPLRSIHPTTGSVQTLVTTGATAAYPGLAAIDSVGRRFFFLSGNIGSQVLIRVDLATLTVSSVPIPMAPAGFIFFERDVPAQAIPLAGWEGLLVLTLTLAIAGAWVNRAAR